MAATASDVEPGAYYGPQGWQDLKGPPGLAAIRPQALDAAVAGALWTASEALSGVHWPQSAPSGFAGAKHGFVTMAE